MEDEEDIWIDTEWLLQVLLAIKGDKKIRTEILNQMSEKSGVPLEKVEEIVHVLTEYVLEDSRSN